MSEKAEQAKTKKAGRVNVGIPAAEHAQHAKIQALLKPEFPSLQNATTDAVRRWNKRFAPKAAQRAASHAASLEEVA